jgi:hypothetical protein
MIVGVDNKMTIGDDDMNWLQETTIINDNERW